MKPIFNTTYHALPLSCTAMIVSRTRWFGARGDMYTDVVLK